MKKILAEFKTGIVIWVWILFTLSLWLWVYATVNNSWTNPNSLEASLNQALKSDNWNKILSNQNYLAWKLEWWMEVPSGAVLAFYLDTCPAGWKAANWTEHELDLRGEFIRGLDNWRTLWTKEQDSFQWHYFWNITDKIWQGGVVPSKTPLSTVIGNYWLKAAWDWFNGTSSVYLESGRSALAAANNEILQIISDWTNWEPRISNETRPRNVALLYCVKI